jgi:twitching motility protein PilT
LKFMAEVLLKSAVELGASDVHIAVGRRPLLRVDMLLQEARQLPVCAQEDVEGILLEMAGAQSLADVRRHRDLEFSTQVGGRRRFRVNAHLQRGTVAMTCHLVPDQVPPLESLCLPPVVDSFVDLKRGLVLVTGKTGDGKSTTLAAILDAMGRKYAYHIATIEDPIEYELVGEKALIEQRELGRDVPGFAEGVRSALRQDPDVIMVGETRDLETTAATVRAAETGHLVFTTLHTQGAPESVSRMVDTYPPSQQQMARTVLADALYAVVNQTLLPRADRPGVIPACEVMICTPAVRNCIRQNRLHEIPNIMQTSSEEGMCTLEANVETLVAQGRLAAREALALIPRHDRFLRSNGAR